MLILEANRIKKYYGERLIFGFDELKVYAGDRIGLVGQNGSGKTTLLNVLAGEIEPDEGMVKRYYDIAYIRQFADESIQAKPKILKEFNLAQKVVQPVFSGGEQTRIKIANAFSLENILLFADEPTSNLDYKGIKLLKAKLSELNSFLVISHDRMLLDSLCNKIIEIKDGKLSFYQGNYSFYKQQVEFEFNQAYEEYEQYIATKINLEEAIKDRQAKSKSMKKTPARMGNSEARLHRREANEKQEKIYNAVNSLKTRLNKLEVKEKPKELLKIKLDFSLTQPPANKIVISAENLTFSYGSKRIFDHTGFKVYNGLKTAVWGENGSGKTTLLNLIFNNVNQHISIVPKAKIGYFHQGFENLDYHRTVLDNVMKDSVQTETIARTILARLLIAGDNVYKKVGVLSGGERLKISFAKLFVSNANVLMLDEPTNYLDMNSIEALESVLSDYEGTVLFVSHDRTFVNAVADRLLVIEDQRLTDFDGKLADFESIQQVDRSEANSETERVAVQMRISELMSRFSQPGTDKAALEAEYHHLLNELRRLSM